MKVAFKEWKVEDHLKTAADRVAYVEAAAEEGTPDAMPDAFADVFRSLGNDAAATACAGIAAYLRTTADASDWKKIVEKLHHAELYEDLIVSEGEIERGETHTTDEVKRMIEDDLKKLSKKRRARLG